MASLRPRASSRPTTCASLRTPQAYRRGWGERVLRQLHEVASPLAEGHRNHAGAAYSDAIRDLLKADGSTVLEPLQGLTMGRRLAWYAGAVAPAPPARPAWPGRSKSLALSLYSATSLAPRPRLTSSHAAATGCSRQGSTAGGSTRRALRICRPGSISQSHRDSSTPVSLAPPGPAADSPPTRCGAVFAA